MTGGNDLHIPVLLEELVDYILGEDQKFVGNKIIVDATLGLGGHATEIIKNLGNSDTFVGIDADEKNLLSAKERILKTNPKCKIVFINSNFVELKQKLKENGILEISAIYYDLGVSSVHFDNEDRGFSFRSDGNLDMRLGKTEKTASEILNKYKTEELYKIFHEFGEEKLSSKISNMIEKERKNGKKFEKVSDLNEVLEKITKDKKTKARIFQALRIEVNDELENLEKSLKDAIDLLEKDGKIFVISFHSLEDRIVKNVFRDEGRGFEKDADGYRIEKKQKLKLGKDLILPSESEIKINSRSRSAKARFAEKI